GSCTRGSCPSAPPLALGSEEAVTVACHLVLLFLLRSELPLRGREPPEPCVGLAIHDDGEAEEAALCVMPNGLAIPLARREPRPLTDERQDTRAFGGVLHDPRPARVGDTADAFDERRRSPHVGDPPDGLVGFCRLDRPQEGQRLEGKNPPPFPPLPDVLEQCHQRSVFIIVLSLSLPSAAPKRARPPTREPSRRGRGSYPPGAPSSGRRAPDRSAFLDRGRCGGSSPARH